MLTCIRCRDTGPAAANAAAIRAYEKVGFKPVGIMRSYERDQDGHGWHDGLLMELLAEDVTGDGPGDLPPPPDAGRPAKPDAGRPAN